MTAGDLNAMNAAILPVIRTTNPTRIVLFMGLKVGRRENGRLREVGSGACNVPVCGGSSTSCKLWYTRVLTQVLTHVSPPTAPTVSTVSTVITVITVSTVSTVITVSTVSTT